MSPRVFAVCMLLAGSVACGGEGTDDKNKTDAAPADVSSCGNVGTECGAGCPSELECVGDRCVPVRGQCGGFAGAECQDASLTCTYPTGDSGGICMTPAEKTCVCTIAPGTLGDCN